MRLQKQKLFQAVYGFSLIFGFCHHLVPQIGVLHLRDILEKGVRDEYNIKQRLFQWYRPTTQD